MDTDIQRMIDVAGTTLADLRDRARVLLGFGAALRRSELVALDVRDLVFEAEGVLVRIRRSKTDAEGHGATVPVLAHPETPHYCPVRAVQAWLQAANITDGPVFRRFRRGESVAETALTDQYVARIVKRLAAQAGLDPSAYSGHSLRSGFLTTAARLGEDAFKMAAQSRHQSLNTVRLYVREAEVFQQHPAKRFFTGVARR